MLGIEARAVCAHALQEFARRLCPQSLEHCSLYYSLCKGMLPIGRWLVFPYSVFRQHLHAVFRSASIGSAVSSSEFHPPARSALLSKAGGPSQAGFWRASSCGRPYMINSLWGDVLLRLTLWVIFIPPPKVRLDKDGCGTCCITGMVNK